MTAGHDKGRFANRVGRILHEASGSMAAEDLARFLIEPDPALGDRCPWDLIADCEDSEFERIVAVVRGEAERRGALGWTRLDAKAARHDHDLPPLVEDGRPLLQTSRSTGVNHGRPSLGAALYVAGVRLEANVGPSRRSTRAPLT